ncbi:MAG TPA: UDP-glucose 4-epimerase GalE [Candidatus Limnocylindrales bacterium]|nr:UDP-glucose 4-epimerase GalE [Candidatus Limnocylindrales bacterium]
MTILVTGGAGYIGSHVVEQLIDRGYDVVVFDNFQAGHRGALHSEAVLVEGDLLDPAAVRALFERHSFDGILHFASRIQVGESMQKPFLYLRDNVHAAENLIEAAVEHGVKRFILSSTANLFDQPTRIPIDETEPIIPGSVYGETKAYAERLLYWMDRIYGMRYCALRYFNASGAHPDGHIGEDHFPETHLIPIVLQVALGQREHVDVFGDDYPTPDGTAIRDYIHVLDLADAHILALEALKDGPSRAYNLGSGRGYSVQEVIETCRTVTGHPIPAQIAPRRAGDAAALVADNSRITTELGWYPEYRDLGSIIQTAWAWQRSHPHGYEDGEPKRGAV